MTDLALRAALGRVRDSVLHNRRLRSAVPLGVRNLLRSRIRYAEFREEQLHRAAELALGGPIPTEWSYPSPYPVVLGIFKDTSYAFAHNVAACRELQVRYRLLDLDADDWIDRVLDSGCDAFLATPSALLASQLRIYKDRLWILSEQLGKRICPSFPELYLWESKSRTRDWLVARAVPHPRTWVFAREDQAAEFCRHAGYPLICKTDLGAAASGVFVLRSAREADRTIKAAFSTGLRGRSADRRNRETGFILLQEHIPHDYEWRVVRIGDSFMCRRKERKGDFASGSGGIGWAAPLPGMLDFAYDVTEKGGFRSMAVDIFENTSGRQGPPYLVNELQALFGAIVKVTNTNEHTGRWLRDSVTGQWRFQPGFFYQNACANLRVEMLLNDMGLTQPAQG